MDYMKEALNEAYQGIEKGHGGPFGSVIVKDGKVVGRGHNRVLLKKDPTCHGEMEAIRDACHNLGTHDLSAANFTPRQNHALCVWAASSGQISGQSTMAATGPIRMPLVSVTISSMSIWQEKIHFWK